MHVIAYLCTSEFFLGLPSNDHRAVAIAVWREWLRQQSGANYWCHRCGKAFDVSEGAVMTLRGISVQAKCSRQIVRTTLERMQRAGWIQMRPRCQRKCMRVMFVEEAPAERKEIEAGQAKLIEAKACPA